MNMNQCEKDIVTCFYEGPQIFRLKKKAEKIGANTLKFVNCLLQEFHNTYYLINCLLHLNQKYGNSRLEAACKRAYIYAKLDLYSVIEVLENNWDKLPVNFENNFEGIPFQAI